MWYSFLIFTNCPINVPFRIPPPPSGGTDPGFPQYVYLSYLSSLLYSGIVPQPFLTFKIFFKIIDQLFCRIYLSLDLSDISSWFGWGYAFLTGINSTNNVSFSVLHIKRHVVSVSASRGSGNSQDLV